MGKCYISSSLGTPKEMSEFNSKSISSDVRKNSLSATGVGQGEGQLMEQNHGSFLRGFHPSKGCHPEAEAEAGFYPKAPENPTESSFFLGCALTVSSALNITLLLLPFFFIGINHQYLPPPGISENMAVPSVPDLQEEKLRSQLEEEKKRYPFFSLAQPQRALRDGLERPRAMPPPRLGTSLGSGSSS